MYNLWFVFIGSLIATVVFIVLLIFQLRGGDDCLHGQMFSIIGLVPCVFLCFVSLLMAFGYPIQAKKDYNEFLETKNMVETVYQDNKQSENLGLNTKVIELNQWLAHAKAEKKQWGNWSRYYNIDVENTNYIVLGGVEQ